jgi:hypothetical protein
MCSMCDEIHHLRQLQKEFEVRLTDAENQRAICLSKQRELQAKPWLSSFEKGQLRACKTNRAYWAGAVNYLSFCLTEVGSKIVMYDNPSPTEYFSIGTKKWKN